MKIIDFYLEYLNEQQPQPSAGDRIVGGVASGLGKVQGLMGKGLMLANLANFSNLPAMSQALVGSSAAMMGMGAYQRWKAKRAAAAAAKQQQMQQPPPQQMR